MKCKECEHEKVIPESKPCCDCRYVIEKCPEFIDLKEDHFKKRESGFKRWFNSHRFIGVNDKVSDSRFVCVERELKSAYNQALDDVLSADCLWQFIVDGKFKVGRFEEYIEKLKEP